MDAIEYEYLRKNGFQSHGKSKTVSSNIFIDGKQVDEFRDEKQIIFLKTQFGDSLKYVIDMKIVIEFNGFKSYDVSLIWTTINGYNDIVKHTSQISGEYLYDLVSQAIVIAKTCDYYCVENQE